MEILDYTDADVAAISRLYYETVRLVNIRDYSLEQVAAWAPEIYSDDFWKKRFKNYRVFVVKEKGQVVGFAEFEHTGQIDCFYVHHLWQGQGVGSKLLKRIEHEALSGNIRRLFADVCITAQPFFKLNGFDVIEELERAYRGCSFKQFFMEKTLSCVGSRAVSWV
ncbi:GNAT family N-acetyltransferase [Nitrococcus mobilis]|uniref:Putative acetyltransferase n=1 Tax=Nitrococcus mobilis Nb-231 TaxID=314278 RepID=A4BV49_9GAMM|nr:GNAT family N-acetyltransferase [Nitrococcus mobilis]EAR20391.1 putative acetyltransferase [Nitrococcus mobilis Nb-231]